MPLTELEESINAELDDNPALESENPDDMLNESYDGDSPMDNDNADGGNEDSNDEDAYEAQSEQEERKDELDQALESIGQDDQMPDYNTDRYSNQVTIGAGAVVFQDVPDGCTVVGNPARIVEK